MTQSAMDWTFKDKSCPAWVQANAGAKGYYRTDYQGQLLSSLIAGDVVGRLPAPERVELIGNVSAVSGAGKLPAGDALALVEKFHADPEREIILRSLNVALDPRSDMVPDNLMPSYRRFLLKNFQAKARELGWTPRAGESDDVRLLRPPILRAVGTEGGDQDLARESRELAEKWLRDRSAVSPDVVRSVLMAAAYNGDRALFDRFFSAFNETQDRQQQQDLIIAMISFRDRSAIDAALELVPAGKIALPDGLPFLFGPGHAAPETRTLAFESLKAHFNEIMDKHPNVFGFDLGAFLPRVGEGFCDAQSRSDYAAFFEPKISRYEGAPRAYAQTLEGIDLCIARKQAQQGSVAAFLQKY
jgi:alanyl aminopeptidase